MKIEELRDLTARDFHTIALALRMRALYWVSNEPPVSSPEIRASIANEHLRLAIRFGDDPEDQTYIRRRIMELQHEARKERELEPDPSSGMERFAEPDIAWGGTDPE